MMKHSVSCNNHSLSPNGTRNGMMKRSVSFKSEVENYVYDNKSSTRRNNSIWYTRKEMKAMKEQVHKSEFKMRLGLMKNDDVNDTKCGIKNYARSQKQVSNSLKTVLLEQIKQKHLKNKWKKEKKMLIDNLSSDSERKCPNKRKKKLKIFNDDDDDDDDESALAIAAAYKNGNGKCQEDAHKIARNIYLKVYLSNNNNKSMKRIISSGMGKTNVICKSIVQSVSKKRIQKETSLSETNEFFREMTVL